MKCETLHLKDFYPFLGEDGCDATVDCYRPFNLTEIHREGQKRPCLLLCPGGGYHFISQREAEPVALQFFPEGYNVFILSYSVGAHRFPQQMLEVAALVELIYKNADVWNCDTARLAIMGFSAGGHLAAQYSTAFDCDAVRARFPESKNVSATLLGYPVISAKSGLAHPGSFENLVGKFPLDAEEEAFFSCDRNVRDDTPPAFLWHTSEDALVSVENSLLYAHALAAHKIPFALHIYPYGHHGLSTVDTQVGGAQPAPVALAHEWLAEAKRWLAVVFA